MAGIGVGVGPAAGGFLIDQFDWTAVFLVNVPIVIAALAAIPKLVPDSRDPEHTRLDPLGAVLSTVGLGILTATIIQAPDWGWTDGRTLGGFGAAAVVLTGFVTWELRTASPMLDVRLFRIRRFTGASGAVTLVFFALFGAIFFLTQYLQEVLDYTPARGRRADAADRARASSSAGRCRRSSPAGSGRATWSPSASRSWRQRCSCSPAPRRTAGTRSSPPHS